MSCPVALVSFKEPKVDRAGGAFQAQNDGGFRALRHGESRNSFVECSALLQSWCFGARPEEHTWWQLRTAATLKDGEVVAVAVVAFEAMSMSAILNTLQDMKGERRVQLYELLKEACAGLPELNPISAEPSEETNEIKAVTHEQEQR